MIVSIVSRSQIVGIIIGATLGSSILAGGSKSTQANVLVEIVLEAARNQTDPFNDVLLDVVFTDPKGVERRVPAFWAGGTTWKARYASPLPGRHPWRTECNNTEDTGLHGRNGAIDIRAYQGSNPLYRHGPLRASSNGRYFEHNDGTPFFWMGDTWWMALTKRLKWDHLETLVADRKAKGFTVAQIVAGIYPDMVPFSPLGANEFGFPWKEDYSGIHPEYFDAADKRFFYIVEQGITPCVVGVWGYHMLWMKPEQMKQHWRYLIARYGALPVVWCVAGEANLPWYLERPDDFPYEDREQAAKWLPVVEYVQRTDPFDRLVSIHPTALGRLNARGVVGDHNAYLLDYDMLQTGHGERRSLVPSMKALRESVMSWPVMPVINSEVNYEGLLGRNGPDVQRLLFWTSILSGAAGHTYGGNGIWQVNQKDAPFGKSPHGTNWGTTPWDEAIKLPGGNQIAWGSRFIRQFPWHRFESHPEWARWQRMATEEPTWGSWIWHETDSATKGAPTEGRFFRRTFELPADDPVAEAVLVFACDDQGHAYLNGGQVLSHNGHLNYARQHVPIEHFNPGENVLAVYGINAKADVPVNPAAILCTLRITLASGKVVSLKTNESWRSSRPIANHKWHTLTIDDSDWSSANIAAPIGGPPWGTPVSPVSGNPHERPYSAGIPGRLRIIYLLDRRPVEVTRLDPSEAWQAKWIDPATGDESPIGRIYADASGVWKAPRAKVSTSDALLMLERAAETEPRPISIHPENGKYFLFRGKPRVLITATEHYGSVVNREFDFDKYLEDAADKKQTMTRTFLLFREQQSSRNSSSPIKPESPHFVAPWPRTGPGKAMDGEPKYDLDQWNPEYFDRLHRFLSKASELGIAVELTIFSHTYGDNVWALNPLRAANNIQGIDDIPWQNYNTLKNPRLVARQFAYARKIIEETSIYDNVYYDICNEPGGGMPGHATPADIDAWLNKVIELVRGELKRLGRDHLIFGNQAFSYTPKFYQELDASFESMGFDAVTIHALPGTILSGREYDMGNFMSKELNLAAFAAFNRATQRFGKPAVHDEDNNATIYTNDAGWTVHRKRAWTAVLGQTHYDFIDFSITAGKEAGTAESNAKIRTWMKHLSEFIHSYDFIHAKPGERWIRVESPHVVHTAMAKAGEDYIAYLADARQEPNPALGLPIETDVTLTLPQGRYAVRLFSPVSGEYAPPIVVDGGRPVTLDLAPFEHDLAFRVTRMP